MDNISFLHNFSIYLLESFNISVTDISPVPSPSITLVFLSRIGRSPLCTGFNYCYFYKHTQMFLNPKLLWDKQKARDLAIPIPVCHLLVACNPPFGKNGFRAIFLAVCQSNLEGDNISILVLRASRALWLDC